MEKSYFVYLVTNWKNTALYTGVTSDLERRIYEHKNALLDGFTKKYNCKKLVYYECFPNPEFAIKREKEIKGWIRKKKNVLIDKVNPEWIDLAESGFQFPIDPSPAAQDDAVLSF